MTVFFVSRHPGAAQWANERGIAWDELRQHLDWQEVAPGDAVIGALPLHLAAEICARGARYLHLALDVPEKWRGCELDVAAMTQCGARLEEFHVERIAR